MSKRASVSSGAGGTNKRVKAPKSPFEEHMVAMHDRVKGGGHAVRVT